MLTDSTNGRLYVVALVLMGAALHGVAAPGEEGESSPGIAAADADEVVIVHRDGNVVLIRSFFSSEFDVVVRMGKGTNGQINFANTWLVPKSSDTTSAALKSGTLIHGCGDDSTPWNLNGTYIGANHGCSNARQLTSPGHGLTVRDLGSEWRDEAQKPVYLIKIVDVDRVWVLSEDLGTGGVWKFRTSIAGAVLTRKSDGKRLEFAECKMAQLCPACRIGVQDMLVDGKTPLTDGATVRCAHLEIVEEYDIIDPSSVLQDAISHPGEERSFVSAELAAVVSNRIVYRFLPRGITVVDHTAAAGQEFRLGYMGFIQSAKLATGTFGTHEYYIPKTLPFTQDERQYDFRGIEDYASRLPSPLRFRAADHNIADEKSLPDRFIQFLGHTENGKTARQVGYAIGYSLLTGLTQPEVRAQNTSSALMLYTSSKSYPSAIDGKMGPMIPAGTRFRCIAYRTYFDPCSQDAATCVYWYREGDTAVVYADYHASVERSVIRLPSAWTGRPFRVVEQTASASLHTTTGAVPAGGLEVSVADDYGALAIAVQLGD